MAKHNFIVDHPVVMIMENNECVELGQGDGLPVMVEFTFENLRYVAMKGEEEILKKYKLVNDVVG